MKNTKFYPAIADLKCIAQHPEARINLSEWNFLIQLAPKNYWIEPLTCATSESASKIVNVNSSKLNYNYEFLKNYAGIVEKNITALPGITEFRYNQLQEIEAVLNYLNIQLRKIRRKHFQKYLEGYARALTSRDAEKYVDGEDEVIDYETIINEVAYLRNRWLGILKGIDSKQWQMGHIVRLRTAGMEDIQV
jgi:hypothetical protein